LNIAPSLVNLWIRTGRLETADSGDCGLESGKLELALPRVVDRLGKDSG
jgi:hypothetical protein